MNEHFYDEDEVIDALWTTSVQDPSDVVDENEESIIIAFGFNMAGVAIPTSPTKGIK